MIVVAVVGVLLVILISAVFFAILFLLCRKRQIKSGKKTVHILLHIVVLNRLLYSRYINTLSGSKVPNGCP